MKKYIILLIMVFGIATVSIVKANVSFEDEILTAVRETVSEKLDGLLGGSLLGSTTQPVKTICAGTATTTPEYLNTTSATSTCQLFVANIDTVDVNWSVTASSTSEIWYETYFSNDDGANKNWYPSRTYSVADGIVTYSGELQTNKLPIETSATTTANTIIKDIEAKYMQVRYLPHSGNAGIYMELVGRNKN